MYEENNGLSDKEYWDDVYYEEHRDDYLNMAGRGNQRTDKRTMLQALAVIGLVAVIYLFFRVLFL